MKDVNYLKQNGFNVDSVMDSLGSMEMYDEILNDFLNGGTIDNILNVLEKRNNVVPTFYLKRIKTDKYYYTFCSPEASHAIVKYLKTRENLKLEDKLFDFTSSLLLSRFQEIYYFSNTFLF